MVGLVISVFGSEERCGDLLGEVPGEAAGHVT